MHTLWLLIFFFVVIFPNVPGNEYDNPFHSGYRYRNSRNCKHQSYSNLGPLYGNSNLENTVYLSFILVLGILFGLMFLGLLKGLLGVCALKRIGEYGMGTLIDLPKPLNDYQEKYLMGREVCYDIAGWPVHPDTGQRTVRMLPVKTEFCLNIIFFLAYPLAVLLKLCARCCCIRDYQGEDDTCFKEVNVIKSKGMKKDRSGSEVDMYNNNDLREAKDISYVINCIRQSEISLEKLNQSKNTRFT